MQGQLLTRIVVQFRGGLVLKAHRLLYHSTLGSRVIKKKKREGAYAVGESGRSLVHSRSCEDRVLDGPASGTKGSKGGPYKYFNPRT